MATGDNLTAAKAWAGAAVGFVAPGAAYLVGVSADGFTGTEWIVAALFCLGGAAAGGGLVFVTENKPKTTGGTP